MRHPIVPILIIISGILFCLLSTTFFSVSDVDYRVQNASLILFVMGFSLIAFGIFILCVEVWLYRNFKRRRRKEK